MTLSGETVMTALNADTSNITESIESIPIPSASEPMTAIVAEETVEDVNETFETLSVDTNDEELANGTAESVDDVMEEFDRLTEINNEDSVESTIEEFERARDILTEAAEEESPLIPENSITTLEEDATARFSGASWFEDIQNQTIIVAGQGGIGSWVSMVLSRMHPRQIFIYDDDVVETVNLAGQLYNKQSVGKKKVNAMATIMKDFSDYNGTMAVDRKWTEESEPGDIMICGFDNMAARKTFFESWLRHIVNHPHPEKCLYLDGRIY